MIRNPKAIVVIGIIIAAALSACHTTTSTQPAQNTQTGPVYSDNSAGGGGVGGVTNEAVPDLVVNSVSAPSPDAQGSMITVSAVISNQSGSAGAGSSFTCLYLNTTSNTVGATFLGSYLTPALTPHGTHTVSTNVTIPANYPIGQDDVVAVCNCSNTVVEANPNNNTNYVGITIN
jgi:hypothetical protein